MRLRAAKFSVLTVGLLLVLLALPMTGAQNQNDSRGLRSLTVTVKFINTPLFNFDNYGNELRSGARKWLSIEVSYYPPLLNAVGRKNYVWLDDLTMEVAALFPAVYRGRNVMALMTGKTNYWSVPMDGKKHLAQALASPQIIARYGRPDYKYKGKDILASVKFYTKNRRLIGMAYSKVKGVSTRQATQLFERYSGPVSNSLRLENAILPRNKTPWAFFRYDFYDLIKEDKK